MADTDLFSSHMSRQLDRRNGTRVSELRKMAYLESMRVLRVELVEYHMDLDRVECTIK